MRINFLRLRCSFMSERPKKKWVVTNNRGLSEIVTAHELHSTELWYRFETYAESNLQVIDWVVFTRENVYKISPLI